MSNMVYAYRDVEVLTIHFRTGGMRVRYALEDYFGVKGKVYTCDVDNSPMLAQLGLETQNETARDEAFNEVKNEV